MVGVFIVLRLISDPIVEFSGSLVTLGKELGTGAIDKVGDFKKRETRITELSALQGGIGFLVDSLKDRDARVMRLNEELRKNEVLAQIGKVSSQIAHDIRSPLAALKISLEFLERLPEQQRLLIRSAVTRIEDIANNLTRSNRELSMKTAGEWVCLLSSLIEPIITEKRMQFRSRLGLDIQLRLGENAYGLFSRVNPNELKRVLSNLINNSVEASEGPGETRVEVFVRQVDGQCGIPDSGRVREFRAILSKNSEIEALRPASDDGSGLGVYHAMETVESLGRNSAHRIDGRPGNHRYDTPAKDQSTEVVRSGFGTFPWDDGCHS